MAKFDGVNLTKTGRVVLAKAIKGKPLNFTRVSCGDGFLEKDRSTYEFTGLINELHDLQIISCELGCNVNGTISPGVAELRALMINKDIEKGFYIREVGIFAKDPDSGEEILYGYCNAGDKSDYMPEYGGSDIVEFHYKFHIVIDQAQNVTAISASGLIYVTVREMADMFGNSEPVKEFWTRTEGDDKKFRPEPVPQTRVTIMGIENLDSVQKQIDEVAEAGVQNSLTFLNRLRDLKHEELNGLQGGTKNNRYHLTQAELKKLQAYKHEELTDLQGGAANNHYHLTQTELKKLQDFKHEELNGLLGGAANNHYHLTQAELKKLQAYKHEELTDLQGGAANDHYHLTQTELKKLQDLTIYDSLNASATQPPSAGLLYSHVLSQAPHPNYKPNLTTGTTGNLETSRLRGKLPIKVVKEGDSYKDDPNTTFIEVPKIKSEEFICNADGTRTEGMANFNQLQIRFGREQVTDYGNQDENEKARRWVPFQSSFSFHPSVVLVTIKDKNTDIQGNKDWTAMLSTQEANGFSYHLEHNDAGSGSVENLEIQYIAIGH